MPYILFQLPSTIFLRHIGVGTWLSFCVISWGAVQLGMGFVKSWGTLLLCRMLLGALEVSLYMLFKRAAFELRWGRQGFYLGSFSSSRRGE